MKNTEKKGKKEHICVGLLAHVDAGKTTLCRSILYVSGKREHLESGSWECIFRYL